MSSYQEPIIESVHFQKAGLNIPGFALRSCWYRTCSHTVPGASCFIFEKGKKSLTPLVT